MKAIFVASAVLLMSTIFLPGMDKDQKASKLDRAETVDTDHCAACHPSFEKQRNRTSSVGQSNSLEGLRKNHLTKGIGYGCLNCHEGMEFEEWQINLCTFSTPAEGVNLTPIDCTTCHGGTADDLETGSIPDGRWSNRLREHHYRQSATACLGCHGDAAPADLVSASVSPPTPRFRDEERKGFAKFKQIPPPQEGQQFEGNPDPN